MPGRKYAYENYIGDGDFIFISCTKADRTKAVSLAENLAGDGIKVFFDIADEVKSKSPEKIAEAIDKCESGIFFISEKACENLAFRNEINYALEIKKDIFCISCDDKAFTHGLDMQLANIPQDTWEDTCYEELCGKLKEHQIITQDTMGGTPVKKNVNVTKQIVFAAIIVVAIALFIFGAIRIVENRVAYYQSAEWILRDADGSEYLNISIYGEDGVKALQGKTIGELDLSGSNIEDLSGIAGINVNVVNVSDCANLHSLKPLMQCENIKTIKLSQDMLKYAYGLRGQGVEIEVTK